MVWAIWKRVRIIEHRLESKVIIYFLCQIHFLLVLSRGGDSVVCIFNSVECIWMRSQEMNMQIVTLLVKGFPSSIVHGHKGKGGSLRSRHQCKGDRHSFWSLNLQFMFWKGSVASFVQYDSKLKRCVICVVNCLNHNCIYPASNCNKQFSVLVGGFPLKGGIC